MKKENLCGYLDLNSYDIKIPFSKTKTEIKKLLMEKEVSIDTNMEDRIFLKSKILSLDIMFFITFCFQEEDLTKIKMTPENYLEGKPLYTRYKEIQGALKLELGHARIFFWSFMNLFDPNNRRLYWKVDSVKIEHRIQNRLGLYEEIVINV